MHAYHGIYNGENRVGSDYDVALRVAFDEGKRDFADIKDTVNYAELFGIVKQRMQVPTPLLERVADGIIRKIKHQYPHIREVELSIYKLEPPIEGFEGRVGVTMHKRFNE